MVECGKTTMVITTEEDYAVALARLEQMFGQVEEEDEEREFELLLAAIEAWERKMNSN